MKKVNYVLISSRIDDEIGRGRVSYGIRAHGAAAARTICDISSHRSRVDALRILLNRHRVSLEHFLDVVEDCLNT